MQPVSRLENGGFVAGVLTLGSGSHPYLAQLSVEKRMSGGLNSADRADALALLAGVHGRLPGLIDHAANVTHDADMRRFLIRSGTAFALERAMIARLTMLAGPSPSTPGDDRCTAALEALRHSLDLLGQSERNGCAAGAALALLADWRAIRPMLEVTAALLDGQPSRNQLPSATEIEDHASALHSDDRSARAARFGVDQLLMQHNALWALLSARHDARQHNLY